MIDRRKLDEIEQLVIHCADTPNGYAKYTIEDIDTWHKQKGYRRNKKTGNHLHVGYHFVIHIDGSIHTGRDLDEVGAHAAPYNAGSIGVCMIGTDQFTVDQWQSLRIVVDNAKQLLPNLKRISGHRDLVYRRYCPGFDVNTWYYTNQMMPDEKHIWKGA